MHHDIEAAPFFNSVSVVETKAPYHRPTRSFRRSAPQRSSKMGTEILALLQLMVLFVVIGLWDDRE
jgi:hypothetical protein